MEKTLPPARRRPSLIRRLLRWALLLFLTLLISGVLFALFLNKVGLPDFLKEQIVAQLHEQGLDLEFSRMRVRWYRGIVVDDLQLTGFRPASNPQVFAEEAQLRLDHEAFKQGRIKLDAVVVYSARLFWPVTLTNQPTRILQIYDIGGELHFHERDQWQLRKFRAQLHGIDIQLEGTLTNASALRAFKRSPRDKSRGDTTGLYHQMLTQLDRIHFATPPVLRGIINGDARNLASWDGRLSLTTPELDSPWGRATNILFTALVQPDHEAGLQVELQLSIRHLASRDLEAGPLDLVVRGSPSLAHPVPTNISLRLKAGQFETTTLIGNALDLTLLAQPSAHRLRPDHVAAQGRLGAIATPWAAVRDVDISGSLATNATNTALLQSALTLSLPQIVGKWGSSRMAVLNLQASHPTNSIFPAPVSARLHLDQPRTRWGEAHNVTVDARVAVPALSELVLGHTNETWPDRLANLPLRADITAAGIASERLNVPSLSLAIDWQAPQLVLHTTNQLYDGEIGVRATLDTTTRELLFAGRSNFDAQKIQPFLTTNGQRWLRKYSWQKPPQVEGAGRIILPAWTDKHPDWRVEFLPNISLAGRFEVADAAYRDVPFSSAQSPFSLTNMSWHLPRLLVTRPEGTIVADYTSDQRSKDFHWQLRSTVDPKAAQPLFEKESQQRFFDYFAFTAPPHVDAEVWGRWGAPELLGAVAKFAVTNLTFRGETVRDAIGEVHYTNKTLTFLAPEVQREGERGTAARVEVDFAAKTVVLSNAFGNLNPQAVGNAIGKKVAASITPYRFDISPTVRASGLLDYSKEGSNTDLHFEVNGGPFHWKVFHLEDLMGNIDWVGKTLVLTNIQSHAHGGRVTGHALFDFTTTNGTDFSFQTTFAGIDLHSFMHSLAMRTNNLEGSLSGQLVIVSARTTDTNSWMGYGDLELRDGLIWDIPVFGIFSPVLNVLVPGLGNSRARQATATYTITNSIIQSRNLQIDATAMRMRYQGTVTFDGRIQGKMEAELLRNIPGLGLIISKLFWPVTKIFEYRITGTLANPKPDPIFIIPRIILLPFQPLKTIKDLLPDFSPKNPQK